MKTPILTLLIHCACMTFSTFQITSPDLRSLANVVFCASLLVAMPAYSRAIEENRKKTGIPAPIKS